MSLRRIIYVSTRDAGNASQLKRTALWEMHKSLNGTMGPFAGFDMPMIYKGHSIPDSVAWTRNECSIFDVSHMLQTKLTGENAINAIESICTADVAGLKDNAGCLSLFTNDIGGIYGMCVCLKVK